MHVLPMQLVPATSWSTRIAARKPKYRNAGSRTATASTRPAACAEDEDACREESAAAPTRLPADRPAMRHLEVRRAATWIMQWAEALRKSIADERATGATLVEICRAAKVNANNRLDLCTADGLCLLAGIAAA